MCRAYMLTVNVFRSELVFFLLLTMQDVNGLKQKISRVCIAQYFILVFCVVCCRALFVCFVLFIWPLYYIKCIWLSITTSEWYLQAFPTARYLFQSDSLIRETRLHRETHRSISVANIRKKLSRNVAWSTSRHIRVSSSKITCNTHELPSKMTILFTSLWKHKCVCYVSIPKIFLTLMAAIFISGSNSTIKR